MLSQDKMTDFMSDRKSRAVKLMILCWMTQNAVLGPSMYDTILGDKTLIVVTILYFLVISVPCVCFFCLPNHKTSAFNALMILAHLRAIPVLYSFPVMNTNKEFFNNVVFL